MVLSDPSFAFVGERVSIKYKRDAGSSSLAISSRTSAGQFCICIWQVQRPRVLQILRYCRSTTLVSVRVEVSLVLVQVEVSLTYRCVSRVSITQYLTKT